MGALQTNVEYLTDRIVNSNATPNPNNQNQSHSQLQANNMMNENYAPMSNDHLVANPSNDFDHHLMEQSHQDNEGTLSGRPIDRSISRSDRHAIDLYHQISR